MNFFKNFLCLLISFVLSSPMAMACPCGCGSTDALYLEPTERFKYSLSFSREFSPDFYDTKGNPQKHDSKLTHIDTYQIASVFSPIQRVSLSGEVPLKKNTTQNNSTYSLADPSAHLIGSLFEKDFYDTFHLSLRLGFSLKAPLSNSSENSSEESIFSSGFWELSPNLSSAVNYQNWTFVAKETFTYRIPKEGPSLHPFVNRVNIGATYTLFGRGSFSGSFNQELRFEPGSKKPLQRYTHNLKASLGVKIGNEKNLTVSYKHPVLAQRNAPVYKEFRLSFSHSL